MNLKRSLLLAAAAVAWAFLGMLYFEKFIPPVDALGDLLMPWRRLFSAPASVGLQDRMQYMQGLLDTSIIIANIGLALMVLSVMALAVYGTLLFQQKQRRVRENELLTIKNREIARRNEFIRYISATIGHEFKNNLGRIKRRLEFVELPGEAKQRIDGNLDKLFSDIDIFKKISDEREAGLVEFERTDLARMIKSIASQYSDLVEFSLESKLASPIIYASSTLLRTVFENLMDNSVKYKKPEQDRAVVAISCTLDADGVRKYVTLNFRDQGVGMTEEQAESSFYKGKGTVMGWGEGLYFAKYVIGLHAGKIRVGKEHTAPGGGTEIIINLPFVEES